MSSSQNTGPFWSLGETKNTASFLSDLNNPTAQWMLNISMHFSATSIQLIIWKCNSILGSISLNHPVKWGRSQSLPENLNILFSSVCFFPQVINLNHLIVKSVVMGLTGKEPKSRSGRSQNFQWGVQEKWLRFKEQWNNPVPGPE